MKDYGRRKAVMVMAKIHELKFEVVPHAPYSKDLAPSDFSLFPNLNSFLTGKRHRSDSETIAATNVNFSDSNKSAYKSGASL